MALRWEDAEDIAERLAAAHPDVDPLTVRFTDLHRWVCALPDFADDPRRPARESSSASRWRGWTSRNRRRARPMAIMQVSRKIDYALRAVIHLANEETSDRACSVAEIAAGSGFRASFSRRSSAS